MQYRASYTSVVKQVEMGQPSVTCFGVNPTTLVGVFLVSNLFCVSQEADHVTRLDTVTRQTCRHRVTRATVTTKGLLFTLFVCTKAVTDKCEKG